jgi:hypothetical protein
VRGDVVAAHADDDGVEVFDGLEFVTEPLGFDGSTRGVVFGVEPQDDAATAQVAEPQTAAAAGGKVEVGGEVAGDGHDAHRQGLL